MNLELILGLSKTGKSKYIYDLIDEDIKNGISPILFVPSQERVKTEENYIEYQGKSGLIGFNVTTISSYMNENIEKYLSNISDKYVTKLDRRIILLQVLKECSSDIKLFKNVLKKEGFFDTLNIYMDIFRKSNIKLEEIKNLNLRNNILKQKVKEIGIIYDLYLKRLNSRFIDDVDKMDVFIQDILQSKIDMYNKNIYFDGYNNFTESEFKFIEKLCTLGANIKVTLDTDIEKIEDIYSGDTSHIFEIPNKTYIRLLKICNNLNISTTTKRPRRTYSCASENLKLLSNNLFLNTNKVNVHNRDDSISINVTNNNYSEICSVARKICKLVHSGYRYDDFVIYTTNIDEYEHIIKKVFYEYNIPIYIDKKYKIVNSKLVSYISLYLEILKNGLNFENGIKILKLGLNNINMEDVYELENYMDEFNINKYSIKKAITLNSDTRHLYNLENINNTINYLKATFSKDIRKNNMKGKDIIKIIYEHLKDSNIFENYQEYIFCNNFSSSEENLVSINIEKQVWGKIKELFNSISKVYDESLCNIEEFYLVFKSSIKDIIIKSIPPTMDEVNLLDVNVSRTRMKKVMFFIGVNEDKFPKKVDQDILFNDNDLELLKQNNFDIKETSSSKFNMQLFNIYVAISNVKCNLNIYVPSSDTSGKTKRMSSIVTSIKKIIGLKINGDVTKDCINIDEEYSKDRIFDEVIFKINNDNTNENEEKRLASICSYFLKDRKYKNILEYKKNDENLKKSTLNSLYDKSFNVSISKLEQFRKCPFSYYMKYCLKIDKKNVFEIKSIDTGNFMHEVIEEFSKILIEKNISFPMILTDDNNIHEKYQDILDNVVNENLEYKMKKYKDSIKYDILKQKLQSTIKRVIAIIATGFKYSNFEPFGYEVEFKKGSNFLPIVIKIDDEKNMNIIGKIDRIDVMSLDDKKYVRVVDYKSSSKTLSLDDIRSGISLQLITYMASFIENKSSEKYIPSGLLYFNLSDKLVNLSEYVNDEKKVEEECLKALRMNGIFLRDVKVLENMDKRINEKSGKLVDISLRNIQNSPKALDEEEFKKLCVNVKDILKDIGSQILNGVVNINPEKRTKACNYCQYSTICRKNIDM